MVYRGLTRGGIRWGKKCCVVEGGQVCDGDVCVCLGGVFGGEVFVRYWECIVGASMVCDNALMQWYMVV